MLAQLIDANLAEMNQGYINSEDGLKMTFSVKIQPLDASNQRIVARINFVTARVKETVIENINQAPLIPTEIQKAVNRLRPKVGSGIDSVTISQPSTGRSVTLEAK